MGRGRLEEVNMRATMPFFAAVSLVLISGCKAKTDMTGVEAMASRTSPLGMASDLPVIGAFPDASEVRLFVENGQKPDGTPIYEEPMGRILNKDQRAAFEASLQIDPIPDELAACFIPHHFFRYYDSRGKELGQIQVCFCCHGVEASKSSRIEMGPDQWLSADFTKLKQFVASLGLPTEVQCR
jgi:hypothetical protein